MKVLLKEAFSLLDGRLSTKMETVYDMLNYIFDTSFMTHELPEAIEKLKELNPEWFRIAVSVIDEIKVTEETNDFEKLMEIMDFGYSKFEVELHKINE
jgi:hypothetical protein